MSAEARTVDVIADLHMSPGPHEHFPAGDELAAFLDDLRARRAGDPNARLVVLGDLFELSGIERGEAASAEVAGRLAVDRLERIFGRHARALGALARVTGAGVDVEIVPGNHDFQLALAAPRARLLELLTAAGGDPERVRVHPLAIELPGLLRAEHGQQRHAMNRVPGMGAGEPAATPIGTQLGELLVELEHTRGVRRAAPLLRFVAGVPAAALALRRDARDSHRGDELDRLSATGPARMAVTTVRAALRGGDDRYMVSAAGTIDRALASRGARVPFYVFGHTHVAADVPLDGESRYLNPGTWSTFRPPGPHRGRLTLVEVDAREGEPPVARLAYWDADARKRVAL